MTSVSKNFKVVAGLSLAWMLLGLAMFVMDLMTTPEQVAAMPAAQQEIRALRPMALMVVFGISTVVGVIGALGLLLRKRWSVQALLVSLIAVVVQGVWSIVGLPVLEKLGAGAVILPLIVTLLGLGIWRYAAKAHANGWLA